MTAEHVVFEFMHRLEAHAIRPSSGPVAGGSIVTVIGRGFERRLVQCGFGQASGQSQPPSTHHRVVSSTMVVCVSPPQPSKQPELVSMVLADEEDSHATELRYQFYAAEAVHRLQPSHGPIAGGTVLTVSGTGFIDSHALRCVIGSVMVGAVASSSSMLSCIAPASTEGSGNVTVAVSNNGQDLTKSGVFFEFRSSASMLSVTPSRGPVGGGTLITVSRAWHDECRAPQGRQANMCIP